LPREIYETLIGMDRKGLAREDPRLTEAEKKALYFIYDFYEPYKI